MSILRQNLPTAHFLRTPQPLQKFNRYTYSLYIRNVTGTVTLGLAINYPEMRCYTSIRKPSQVKRNLVHGIFSHYNLACKIFFRFPAFSSRKKKISRKIRLFIKVVTLLFASPDQCFETTYLQQPGCEHGRIQSVLAG